MTVPTYRKYIHRWQAISVEAHKYNCNVQGTCLHVANAGIQIADALPQKMALLGFHIDILLLCRRTTMAATFANDSSEANCVGFDSDHL